MASPKRGFMHIIAGKAAMYKLLIEGVTEDNIGELNFVSLLAKHESYCLQATYWFQTWKYHWSLEINTP